MAAGACLAASAPPWDHWWLAIVGCALLHRSLPSSLASIGPRGRASVAAPVFLAFSALFLVTLAWARQFSLAGWPLLAAAQAMFFAVPAAVLIPRPRRAVPHQHTSIAHAAAFVLTLTIGELVRTHVPFGGLPLGGFTLGQTHGPLAPAAAVLGETGLITVVATLAVIPHTVAGRRHILGPKIVRRTTPALAALLACVAVVVIGHRSTPPPTGTLTVATVQAGGPQATPREQQQPAEVFADHVVRTASVRDPVDLIVWPEDTVQVHREVGSSEAGATMSELAQTHDAAVIAGVVEVDKSARRFRNLAAAWGADGTITGQYEKVQRVPFGEYVPGRSLLRRVVDLSAVPYDAHVGTTAPVLDVGRHRVGVAVSYEGLFSRRARASVRHGAELLVVPTNAASYRSPVVAESQLEAARLRAIESGRWVVQAAPTGFSTIVDAKGSVQARSTIGDPAVLQQTVSLSQSLTPYARWGDRALLVAMGALLAIALQGHARRRGTERTPVPADD